jgi:hypothetical protein
VTPRSRRTLLSHAVAAALAGSLGACGSDDEPEPNEGTSIVSIGESVASGEGNPGSFRHPWDEARCHRSGAAGQTIAGRKAASANPGTAFYSFACSGATIPIGLLDEYKGVAPNPLLGKLPLQLDEVAKVKAASKGGIAALLISIGANDIGFAKIVKFCLFETHCPSKHFDPAFPYTKADSSHPTLERWVNDRLGDLPDAYAQLDTELRPLVESDRVVIVTYFDPTTGANGIDCSYVQLKPTHLGLRPDESAWARQHLLAPLNQQVEAAKVAYGWNLVPGVAEHFSGHGICAQPKRERWVHLIGEGPLTGTFHPNEEGHRQIAAAINPVLDQVVNP